LDHLPQAVDGEGFGGGDVAVAIQLAHADADVEPGVAVDEIVAAAPFEGVVAVTAEQNVSARPRHDSFRIDVRVHRPRYREAAAEQCLDAVKSVDTGPRQPVSGHIQLDLDLFLRP